METIDHVTPRESLESLLCRSDTGAVRFRVSVEAFNKGVPRLTKARVGLLTPSSFTERPDGGRSAVPMYLGGEGISSNEYEDEPDLGSSSGVHSSRFAQLSSESSLAHRAMVATGTERYPPYGPPRVDRGSRALHDRVVALEQFQSAEFAQLQQELRYQKAKVAHAAQTASNIQVELGSQIVRLHDRVAALEKLAYAA
ncbi:hypothetical protein PC121_g22000 [Phytophthora cactorum]|nr:hypothetical protein PC120_g26659 [Phytophthora cactorum]KAG3044281.1 hypothetical protein PC121_g22000 [Phytophthora cactorum]KAG4037379.1 hypothetical protein PC123_g27056 [Phytophthora cactorum]